jgi:hypothetical protein
MNRNRGPGPRLSDIVRSGFRSRSELSRSHGTEREDIMARSSRLFPWLAIALAFAPAAWAQQDEDHTRVCPLLTAELVRTIMPAVTGHGVCQTRCSGCGCKGGPGYRDGQGKCVGYGNIIQKCGPAPHSLCRAECAPIANGCDHGRVWLKTFLERAGLSVGFAAAVRDLPPAQQEPLQDTDQPGDNETNH